MQEQECHVTQGYSAQQQMDQQQYVQPSGTANSIVMTTQDHNALMASLKVMHANTAVDKFCNSLKERGHFFAKTARQPFDEALVGLSPTCKLYSC